MNAKSPARALCRITLLAAALSVSADAAWPQAQTDAYKFQTLDFPNASATAANGINNSGQVVGSYQIGSTTHGFLRSQGQFTTIDDPNAFSGTYASGISNSGAVVGTYLVPRDHGYLFSGGQFSDLLFPALPPHENNTFAAGVNSSGLIVGYYQPYLFETCGNLYGPLLHGWIFSGGSFTQIDFPGECQTEVFGINDTGQMVGSTGGAFIFANGSFSTVTVPGSTSSRAFGINNFGDVVGDWTDASGNRHGFIRKNGNITTFDFPNATYTTAFGINDDGDIVGSYVDANGQSHGFITDPVALVDPVPDLLSGPAVISVAAGAQLLATKGTKVQGVAADGVTQVVVRIQADRVGDQFILTLINDQNGPINPDEDGALGNPGDTTFTQNHMTVTAVDTGSGPNGPNPPFAFAIYRAPKDFARQVSSGLYKTGTCQGVSLSDDQLKCRAVTLKVQTPLGNIINTPVTILRPPVILIHGLWSDKSSWYHFSPLFSTLNGADQRFHIGLVDYSAPPTDVAIVSSNPDYSGLPAARGLALLANAGANSLGFQYNARGAMSQITKQINVFKTGDNPIGMPFAAIQVDIVAHSMGGDISRTLVFRLPFSLQNTFLSNATFGQGSVHKLITIDTPHLGSTLATQLLQNSNSCAANAFAIAGLPVFGSVQVAINGPGTFSLPGAVGDLVDSPLSQALQNIAQPGDHPLPTALIAGTANPSNLASLGSGNQGVFTRALCPSSPLFQKLSPSGWPTVFNEGNDAIVGLNSQFNGLTPDPGAVFDGNVHSAGILPLGFTGPTVLDSGPVPNYVITLLNTPVGTGIFHLLNP